METEGIGDFPPDKGLGDNYHCVNSVEENKKSLCALLEDVSAFNAQVLLNHPKSVMRNLSRNRYEFIGMKRSASVAVMNSFDNCGDIQAEEHKFFVKLKYSSKELRNKIWEKQELKQKKEVDEELMKCKKSRFAAIRTASDAIEAVQAELCKTPSLTFLRGRLQEAETNNKELKESICYKMADRSLQRLSSQPDMARLVWQIISVKSQVTVLQERLQNLSDKFQNISPIPSQSKQDSSSFRERASTSSLTVGAKKMKTGSYGWKSVISRIFGGKRDRD